MAKYLNVVFRGITSPKPLAMPNRVAALWTAKYSANADSLHGATSDPCQRDDEIDERQQQRLLKVAIIGVPNAGKSSLINSIVQRSVGNARRTIQVVRCQSSRSKQTNMLCRYAHIRAKSILPDVTLVPFKTSEIHSWYF